MVSLNLETHEYLAQYFPNIEENEVLFSGTKNVSDPDALVRFPGFGFWPIWYFEMFRERVANVTLPANDEEKKVT